MVQILELNRIFKVFRMIGTKLTHQWTNSEFCNSNAAAPLIRTCLCRLILPCYVGSPHKYVIRCMNVNVEMWELLFAEICTLSSGTLGFTLSALPEATHHGT